MVPALLNLSPENRKKQQH